jgi:hypothetical protein
LIKLEILQRLYRGPFYKFDITAIIYAG